MTEQVTQLNLYIQTDSEADAEEMAKLAVELRELLLELDIESADPLTVGQAPPGKRTGEMVVAGALTVMLARTGSFSSSSLRQCSGGLPIKNNGNVLVVDGITLEDQRKLIQFFIEQNTDETVQNTDE